MPWKMCSVKSCQLKALYMDLNVCVTLQILAFFLRPNKDSKYRKYWNWYHHWVGRLVLFFAAVNIVLGIKVGGGGNSWKIGYGLNLAILLITIITLEVLAWTRWKNNSGPTTTY